MDKEKLKPKLKNLLSVLAPIKAKKLATILSEEFGLHVDLSDVNSILYAMKAEGIASIDNSYLWSLSNSPLPPSPVTIVEPKIEFTPEQLSIINLDPSDHLLIRGQAGSGKTTVLAARAGKIISAMNQGSLLFLTYNTALCAYVEKAFQKTGTSASIDVRTFHDWSRSTAKALGYEFKDWIDTKERSQRLGLIINDAKEKIGDHRLFEIHSDQKLPKWWSEEIAWIFGQYITRLNDYLETPRIGRGTSIKLSKEDRRFVWFVFEAYSEWLEEMRSEDYDNPGGLVLRAIMEQNKQLPDEARYDHVFIDEVQDFDKSWLLAIIKVPKVSFSMAGDLAQKIYKRSFTWSSVGVQVKGGRSKKLSESHRTTKEIMAIAEYLLVEESVVNNEDENSFASSRQTDEKVNLIIGSDPKSAYEAGYDWIADNYGRTRNVTVAVAMPFSNQLFPAQKSLESRGVTVTQAKGKKLGKLESGIVVTTYHQLKGLEFDYVVIMGLHDAQYPGRLLANVPQDDWGEEENLMKRVLFVAMTRARKTVTLIGSRPFCRFFQDIPESFFNKIGT